jgi:thymidine phosphorylase
MRFFRKLIADKHSTGGIGDKVKKHVISIQISIEIDWSKINESILLSTEWNKKL